MRTSPPRVAVLGALLLLAAAAAGCGVGLPTQPDLDRAAGGGRLATAQVGEEPMPLEMGDPSASGGGVTETAPQQEEIVPSPGPGGKGWGYGRKKARKLK